MYSQIKNVYPPSAGGLKKPKIFAPKLSSGRVGPPPTILASSKSVKRVVSSAEPGYLEELNKSLTM